MLAPDMPWLVIKPWFFRWLARWSDGHLTTIGDHALSWVVVGSDVQLIQDGKSDEVGLQLEFIWGWGMLECVLGRSKMGAWQEGRMAYGRWRVVWGQHYENATTTTRDTPERVSWQDLNTQVHWCHVLWVSTLHYSTRSTEVRGGSDIGFSLCAALVRANTTTMPLLQPEILQREWADRIWTHRYTHAVVILSL